MARQDWATLNYTQQYEILHNVAQDHSRVTLNFEALSMAIKASQASEAIKKSLGNLIGKTELHLEFCDQTQFFGHIWC